MTPIPSEQGYVNGMKATQRVECTSYHRTQGRFINRRSNPVIPAKRGIPSSIVVVGA
jgi:hypothetical protein